MSADDLPTIGSPALLAEHRKRSNATLRRAKIAEGLRKLAGHIAKNQVKAGSPTAAFVVLITDGEPVLTWYGDDISWDDLDVAGRAMRDAQMGKYPSNRDRRIADLISEGWRDRRRFEAKQAQKRVEEANAKPWQCEHCDRRFKTERGANQHERGCWRNPGARQYQTGGGYRMFTRDDGTYGGHGIVPSGDPLPDDS